MSFFSSVFAAVVRLVARFWPRAGRIKQVIAEATIDGMAFFDGSSTGGAFRLSRAADDNSTELISDWTIEVRAGSRTVVARGEGGATYEEARDDALAAANKGLDFMCLRGGAPMGWRSGTRKQSTSSGGQRTPSQLFAS